MMLVPILPKMMNPNVFAMPLKKALILWRVLQAPQSSPSTCGKYLWQPAVPLTYLNSSLLQDVQNLLSCLSVKKPASLLVAHSLQVWLLPSAFSSTSPQVRHI